MTLPSPAFYFPIGSAGYSVAPALRPLRQASSAQDRDGCFFQIDCEWPAYRQNYLQLRGRRPDRWLGASELSPEVRRAASAFIAETLAAEHPQLFTLGGDRLVCSLTGDEINISKTGADVPPGAPYRCVLDTLMAQVQEDLAIVVRDGDRDWLAWCHIHTPSNWDPVSRLGSSFAAIHAPVPGMEPVIRTAAQMVGAMIDRGPFVRFVWSLQPCFQLNRHPSSAQPWEGCRFLAQEVIFRVERQCLLGMPSLNSALFFIRAYQYPLEQLTCEQKQRLAGALRGMSRASLAYKGLLQVRDPLLDLLADEPAEAAGTLQGSAMQPGRAEHRTGMPHRAG